MTSHSACSRWSSVESMKMAELKQRSFAWSILMILPGSTGRSPCAERGRRLGSKKLKVVTLVDKSAQQATQVIRSAQCPPSKKAVNSGGNWTYVPGKRAEVLHQKQQAQELKERANHCRKCQRIWKGGAGWVECESDDE